MDGRLRAVSELFVPEARESVGLHEYDGVVQDLSPSGVRGALARLGGPPVSDPVIEAHLGAFEERGRIVYGELEQHRRSPLLHLQNLDLACYDRHYAPAEQRQAARRRHLSAWPDAVDAALESLAGVPGPVAAGLLPAVEGLVADLGHEDDGVTAAARAAHRRLVTRVQDLARRGDPDPAIGAVSLARLMGAPEAMTVDLGRLALRADAERSRLGDILNEACGRIEPGRSVPEVVAALLADHPDGPGVVDEAVRLVQEVIAFTLAHGLVPDVDGECRVGPAPPSRRWAMAMISPSAPFEDDAPSWYYITPPEPSWPIDQQQEWLSVFSVTTLPAITVHEVAPGHFAHFRCLRRIDGEVRRALLSNAFIEGWAHYAEELCLEEGFRANDPRYGAGVALEALVRVTRLAVAIGIHTGSMSMDEAVRRFEADAYLAGPAARSEAARATFDPGYGCYTWGKLEIRALRDEAQAQWGLRYSHRRFHQTLLEQGAPPLGLMGTSLGE
ncbi:MAG TPA: DUF885 family protein [Acidimicrobiales bacterium]|jgi:hypothetical protein